MSTAAIDAATSPVRRFVAIALGENDSLAPLPDAVPDADALARLLEKRHGYSAEVLANPANNDDIQTRLPRGGWVNADLIVYWIGHGQRGPDGTLELLGTKGRRTLASAAQLGQWAAETGARQVMLLLDTCHSGGGLVGSLEKAFAVMSGRNRIDGDWFGVLAASRAEQGARAGALVEAFRSLLDRGPRDPDARWTPGQPHLRGEDVLKVLAVEWSGGPQAEDQTVVPMNFGASQRPMLHNPRFDIGLGAQPVEHLLQAARGGGDVESHFTGRTAALSAMVGWLRRQRPGLLVLTGPAGCGKSALLGRLASLSMPVERERLLRNDAPDPELDPGIGSIHAQLVLRGVTVESAPERLARLLGADPAQGLPGLMVLAQQRLRQRAPLVLLLDGLDEAGEAAGAVAQELLAVLARQALVIVGTRRLDVGDVHLRSLPGVAVEVVDLADDPAATLDDVRRYVVRRLTGASPRMDPSRVAAALTTGRGADAAAPFLLARLVTSQLRADPVDTSTVDWQLSLVSSAQTALEHDLRGVVLAPGGQAQPEAARELMSALARAQGPGFPADDVWPAVATHLSRQGIAYGRDDVYALLDQLGRHVVTTVEAGQQVYRIAHQVLADYLLSTAAADAPLATARAVTERWSAWIAAGNPPQTHGYLWSYAWLHLADAGADGLALLEATANHDRPAFRLDLALAYERAADRVDAAGDPVRALAWRERSVDFRRELGEPGRLALALSRLSLARSKANDDGGAEAAAAEAAAVARTLSSDPQAREVIVGAWLARSRAQLRLSNFDAARRWAQELLDLVSAGDAEESHALCMAHMSLGIATSLQGDIAAARLHCRRAVEVFDRVADAETDASLLHEVLAAWMVAESMVPSLRDLGSLAADAPPPDPAPGLRLLAEHQRRGPLRNDTDVATAKGLLSLVRLRAADAALSLPDLPSQTALLREAIALADGASTDAVLMRGIALAVLAQFEAVADAERANALLDEAIAELRVVAEGSAIASYQLGECLNLKTQFELGRSKDGIPGELAAAVARQLEAVAFMRRVQTAASHAQLVAALTSLAWLQTLAGETDLAAATRVESLRLLPSFGTLPPPLHAMIAGSMADQAAYLSNNGRAVEAVAMAEQCVAIADLLPAGPTRQIIKAGGQVNSALAQLALGRSARLRELLEDAERRVADLPNTLPVLVVRADVSRNLALLDLEEGLAAQALAQARRCVELLATPGLPAAATATAPLAEVVLGQAECAAGELEAGQRRLQAMVEHVRGLVDQQRPDSDLVVIGLALNILQVAPDLWPAIADALKSQPALRDRVGWGRSRPPGEWAALTRELADALQAADPARQRTLRQIVRGHRSLDPERFDAAWQRANDALPSWLSSDLDVEWLVIGWWNTPGWLASRDYLQAHPALLGAGTDAILEEFALDPSNHAEAERHRRLLDEARRSGVDPAYAPLLLGIEVLRWIGAEDPPSHLEKRPELGRPEVGQWLHARAGEGDPDAAAFLSVWELLQRSESALAFELFFDPSAGAKLLAASLHSSDAPRLRALARLVWTRAAPGPLRRQSALVWEIAETLEASGLPTPSLPTELAGLQAAEGTALVGIVTGAMSAHPGAAEALAPLITRVVQAGGLAVQRLPGERH